MKKSKECPKDTEEAKCSVCHTWLSQIEINENRKYTHFYSWYCEKHLLEKITNELKKKVVKILYGDEPFDIRVSNAINLIDVEIKKQDAEIERLQKRIKELKDKFVIPIQKILPRCIICDYCNVYSEKQSWCSHIKLNGRNFSTDCARIGIQPDCPFVRENKWLPEIPITKKG